MAPPKKIGPTKRQLRAQLAKQAKESRRILRMAKISIDEEEREFKRAKKMKRDRAFKHNVSLYGIKKAKCIAVLYTKRKGKKYIRTDKDF